MLDHVVCPSCGDSLTEASLIYRLEKARRMAARYADGEVLPAYASTDPARDENLMEDVIAEFHRVRLTKCCIVHIITNVQLTDHF